MWADDEATRLNRSRSWGILFLECLHAVRWRQTRFRVSTSGGVIFCVWCVCFAGAAKNSMEWVVGQMSACPCLVKLVDQSFSSDNASLFSLVGGRGDERLLGVGR